MDRTITIRITTETLPAGIRGLSMMTDKDAYTVCLASDQDDQQAAAAFIHEMLHVYHRDHERTVAVDQLEEERHREAESILRILLQ